MRIIGGLRRLGIWLAVLLTWEAAYRLVGWQAVKFPAPSHILDATLAMLGVRSGFAEPLSERWPRPEPFEDTRPDSPFKQPIYKSALVQANLVSATRLSIGFAISILLGTVLGLAMWRSSELDKLLGGLFLGFQTLPSVCWVPLGIIIFGLRESAVLFVLVMGSFFAVAIALRDGLRTIPPIYQRAGQMLGAGGWKLYYYVLLPAAFPAMVGSLRQGFSFAWRSLMGAELILAVSNHGLGALLELGRVNGDPPQVLAVMIVMVLIGMAADRYIFARLQQRVQARFGLSG